MEKENSGRLIILAGPSCVGKSPLAKALARFFPELSGTLQPLVLYNSRDRRPGERDGVDYHFRSRKKIDSFTSYDNYIMMEVRGDLQALDLNELSKALKQGNVFFEGNPFIGKLLLTHPSLSSVSKISVFMSPVTREEILNYRSDALKKPLPEFIKELMQGKLLRRTKKQKGELSGKDFEEIERRASSAYNELKLAYLYQNIIPNHDGEDSENWTDPGYPSGDAGSALNAFSAILRGEITPVVEKWDKELLDG